MTMITKCGDCKNLKAVKENGRHVLVCSITNHTRNVHDKVICGNHKPNK